MPQSSAWRRGRGDTPGRAPPGCAGPRRGAQGCLMAPRPRPAPAAPHSASPVTHGASPAPPPAALWPRPARGAPTLRLPGDVGSGAGGEVARDAPRAAGSCRLHAQPWGAGPRCRLALAAGEGLMDCNVIGALGCTRCSERSPCGPERAPVLPPSGDAPCSSRPRLLGGWNGGMVTVIGL